jgi:hypothetical protein
MVEIWDVDAGYMDNDLLTEQMRLVSGLLDKSVGSGLVMPDHWIGHEVALMIRLNQLIAEMKLRGIHTPEFQDIPEEAVVWPSAWAAPLHDQLDKLKARHVGSVRSRVPIPKNEHELWAHYKHSVMARSQKLYLTLGQRVALRQISFERLLAELITIERVTPHPFLLRNSLHQMWGYVSKESQLNINETALPELLHEVQRLARVGQTEYLMHGTALAELACWCVLKNQ